jgi:hypothetical protein
MNSSGSRRPRRRLPSILNGSFVSGCFSAMVGDVNNAEIPAI